MPHVIVKMHPGRSDDQKERLAEAIVDATTEIAGCPPTAVSVAIEEIDADDWAETVYRPDIVEASATLVKAPGYNPFED